MQKIVWYLRQLLPLKYISCYGDNKTGEYVAIWRMWLGKVYDQKQWKVMPY